MRTALVVAASAPFVALVLGGVACEPSAPRSVAPTVPTTESTASGEPPALADASVDGAADAAEPSNVKTLFVREALADCEGEGPRKCMQVRESENDEWTLFYSAIKGFEYEEGFAYELRVEVTSRAAPPAGGSSKAYRLVEIVSKKAVAKP